MKDRIKNCEIFRDNRSTPSVSENGKTFQLDNKESKVEVVGIKVDGCVFTKKDGIKCDYLLGVESKKKLFYIELKGTDIIKAIEQIETTISKTKSFYPNWVYEARIVLGNRVPGVTDRRQYDCLSNIVKPSGGRIIIKHQDLYKEPYKVWNITT